MTAFEEMGVLPEIAKAVDEMEWTLPTDVQNEAVPLILGGGDVLMAAETGSGKTGAFCLPIQQIVWETLRDLKEGKNLTEPSQAAASTKWGFSLYDRGPACAVTPDGLRCQSRESKEWHGTRATKGVSGSGKYYFESIVADEGLCRVGWSTQQASLDLGTDRFGFGFGGTGKKSNNRNFDDYGEPFGKCDVIGCCLNLDDMEVRFCKNGVDLGSAFKLPASLKSTAFFPAVVLKNAEMQFNFGDEKFKHEPPSGYIPICQANRAENNSVKGQGSKQQKILPNAPQAIILEPSRELAEQTYNNLKKFGTHLNSPTVKALLIIGGTSVNEQLATLQAGVDIVVATPGRLEDFIGSKDLLLNQCRFFVLDEADGLLKAGYGQLINRMHSQIPKFTPDGKRLQMVVCSATLHDFEVKKLAEKLMHFPTWVDLKGEDAVPETVHHVIVPINPKDDRLWHTLIQNRKYVKTDQVHYRDEVRPGLNSPEALSEAVKILKGEYCVKAIDKLKMDQAMIFCRTKVDCDNLETYLVQKGKNCVCLHGDRKPHERKANLERFKRKEADFLICTDVAARGLDISGLPFMINVTLPDDKANYLHRIGRVGRAERMGLAISLVATVPEKVWYHGEWCSSRGRNCSNTKLTDNGGCCIWYNETQYLADIEDHLNITIQQVTTDIDVPCNEFDGKVTYGQKAHAVDTSTLYHTSQTLGAMKQLTELEAQAQLIFLNRHFAKDLAAAH